jgi:pyridoxal phosphate enzyme (YggS family)
VSAPGGSPPAPEAAEPDASRVAEVRAAVTAVHRRIRDAGGDPDAVQLIAVTKGFGPEAVALARAAGLVDLGENYAQELVAKAGSPEATDPALGPLPRWHAIGRLQRNKIRILVPHVALWQSIDRIELAAEVANRAPGAGVLVQVNVSGEDQKGGCAPAEAGALVTRAREAGLEVRGLMAVGPAGDPEGARAGFARLGRLADEFALAVRSMGMSGDLEAAITEGATMVRLGTSLFGPRPPRSEPRSAGGPRPAPVPARN